MKLTPNVCKIENFLFLFSGGYPYISLLKNTAYNVGFNSTQAGFVSLLGNAALALGGKLHESIIDIKDLGKLNLVTICNS